MNGHIWLVFVMIGRTTWAMQYLWIHSFSYWIHLFQERIRDTVLRDDSVQHQCSIWGICQILLWSEDPRPREWDAFCHWTKIGNPNSRLAFLTKNHFNARLFCWFIGCLTIALFCWTFNQNFWKKGDFLQLLLWRCFCKVSTKDSQKVKWTDVSSCRPVSAFD